MAHDRQQLEGGDQAVAGGVVLQENHVAGLFAAQDVALGPHFFQDVAVTDFGFRDGDALPFAHLEQAQVAHDGGDDGILFQLALAF